MKRVEKVIVNLGIESIEKQKGWYEYIYIFNDEVCTLPRKFPVYNVKDLDDVRKSIKYKCVDLVRKNRDEWIIGQSFEDEIFTDMFEILKYNNIITEVYAIKENAIIGEGKKEGNKITVSINNN